MGWAELGSSGYFGCVSRAGALRTTAWLQGGDNGPVAGLVHGGRCK
jgi:hypothetical protein